MFFSIIIPVYNVEKYLNDCLLSVTNQDFKDYEVILIDDGSKDSCGAICDEWKSDKIKVIHQELRGLDGARNTGLDAASGEWIIFLDSDDELCDGMLSTLYSRIQEYSADMYCYNMVKMHEDGTVFQKGIYHAEHEKIVISEEGSRLDYYVKRLIRYSDSWEVIFRCFNRRIIEEHNLRFQKCSEIFAEDLAFTLQYLLWAGEIQMLCDIMYRYRQAPTSIMHTLDQRTILPRIINLIKAFYGQVNKSGQKYIRDNFDLINLGILDFHISHKLDEVPVEEIKEEIEKAKSDKIFRKLMTNAKSKAVNNPDIFMLRPWL